MTDAGALVAAAKHAAPHAGIEMAPRRFVVSHSLAAGHDLGVQSYNTAQEAQESSRSHPPRFPLRGSYGSAARRAQQVIMVLRCLDAYDDHIADDVLAAARSLARARGIALGEALSELARRGLEARSRHDVAGGFPTFHVAEHARPFGQSDIDAAEDEDDVEQGRYFRKRADRCPCTCSMSTFWSRSPGRHTSCTRALVAA